jgi:hypothetical protein
MGRPVEHSVASVAAVRPWRTATLVASTIAAIELVILLIAGVVLLTKPVASRVEAAAKDPLVAPAKPPAAERKATKERPVLARSETSVLVLNGNGRTGAAADVAARVHRVGYIVGGVGNAPRSDYGRSVVMYRPGHRAEARRLARDLRVPVVGPLDGMPVRQLLGAHLALVVGQEPSRS